MALLAAARWHSARAANEKSIAIDAPQAATTFSVYDLDTRWRDAHGNERLLASLRGRPQVLALVYTHCTSVCPLTVSGLQRVEEEIGDRAGFVLVSMDPARDTPAQLSAYAAAYRLSSRWTLLAGPESSVRELTALIGAKYRRVAGGEIDHSSTLTVLDGDGRIVAQFDQADAAQRVAAVLKRFPVAGHRAAD